MISVWLCSINLVWILQLVSTALGECPASNGYLHRIGNTRFYIFHREERGSYTSWNQAYDLCGAAGMRVARVDKLTSFFSIAHPLREIVHQYRLKDTWCKEVYNYWIAAKYNYSSHQYTWRPTKDTEGDHLKYVNFHYRKPRPIGAGTHLNYRNRLVHDHVDQCLAFSFPFYGLKEQNGLGGYAPSFDERACISSQARHAMCESVDPACKLVDPGPYVLSEGKDQYFEIGNWIIGDRKYLINWKQRNFTQAKHFCETLGLKLYTPNKEQDVCLIPYIKMWGRNITVSKFWTNWNYDRTSRQFKDEEGNSVGKNSVKIESYHDTHDREKRSAGSPFSSEDHHCVALAHWFEFPNQMPCETTDVKLCHWHFMDFVPANCLNPHGTICQHEDADQRSCEWSDTWRKNMTEALIATATVPFGVLNNTQYLRSTYKQTFGSMYCPPGYSMIRERNTKWHTLPDNVKTQAYDYDYRATYWVVDPEKFKKPKGSLCSVSRYNRTENARHIKKVPCSEWYFYLCKRRFKLPTAPKPPPPVGFSLPAWKWDDRPTPRKSKF